ncbi:bacteriohemerythrin [Paraburkholderia domus]|uniref:bacteriohemerythrin n=1 Tax=Paraburkholderia domus TaxID=2793075 RepID=UPI001B0583A7|nr:hemerythrin family protein [Paraburkholderia domus]CAE6791213.1 Bacteriohemerythrin [Paraburkholderia domus]
MDIAADLDWNDRYLIGHQGMDDSHREFVTLVNAILCADDQQLPAALEAFVGHIEEHFRFEEHLMRKFGYPATDCHIEEHEKVLASVPEVRALVNAGQVGVGRELAQALADWFPGHSDHMDSAIAAWVVKKTSGGAPVVLRRAMQLT